MPLEVVDPGYDEDRQRSEVEHLAGRAGDDEVDRVKEASRADDDQRGL